jgi:hypothetical protein
MMDVPTGYNLAKARLLVMCQHSGGNVKGERTKYNAVYPFLLQKLEHIQLMLYTRVLHSNKPTLLECDLSCAAPHPRRMGYIRNNQAQGTCALGS